MPQDNTCGEECISSGSATPLPQGAGPKRSPILGVPFYLCLHPLMQNYQFDVVTQMGRGLVFKWSSVPHPNGRGPSSAPSFGVPFYVFVTLCHRTTEYDVVTHVGEVRVSWGSPTPLIPRERIVLALSQFLWFCCIYTYIL